MLWCAGCGQENPASPAALVEPVPEREWIRARIAPLLA
jgi:hypothetical protein